MGALLGKGFTFQEIGTLLGISAHTVTSHVAASPLHAMRGTADPCYCPGSRRESAAMRNEDRDGGMPAAAVLAAILVALSTGSAVASGNCAQPVSSGDKPFASDCLFILRTAVGQQSCVPSCVCAPKGTLPAKASDALLCLRKATGQDVALDCPCGPPCANGSCAEARATCDDNVDAAEDAMIEDCPETAGAERTECLARTSTAKSAGDEVCESFEPACEACCLDLGFDCTMQPEIPTVLGGYEIPSREILEQQEGLPPGPGGQGFMLLDLATGAMGFDPALRTPGTAAAECAGAIISCFEFGKRNFAGCVSTAPTCPDETPWQGNEGACCVPACLEKYQALRRSGRTDPEAIMAAIYEAPSCMPGVDEYTMRSAP